MYRLLVNPGSPHAWAFPLKPSLNTIGRDSEADFIIDHDSLSSIHCEIEVTAGRLIVRDPGSTNGTFVNDVLIREADLRPGDTLQLGSIRVLVEEIPTPEEAPTSADKPELDHVAMPNSRLHLESAVTRSSTGSTPS